MDNLAAHKTAALGALRDGSGFTYRYLHSYLPDLNPIEPAWAKIKGLLHKAAARTVDALHVALAPTLDTVAAHEVQGFFRHAYFVERTKVDRRFSP